MVRSVVLAACAALVGCGPIDGQERGVAREAIVGGSPAPAEAQVFFLKVVGDNAASTTCTATLIGARTLLTAAHCVDPRRLGAATVVISATNKPDANSATASDYQAVIEARAHPGSSATRLDNDVAVALLQTSPELLPWAWNTQPVTSFGGKPLRVLGYGSTGAAGQGRGIRRQVALAFRQISAGQILIGDQLEKGICAGDSGGPSLHTFPDGVERVVGVHSATLDPGCVDGSDTRVDSVAPFIQAWLEEKEAPACWEDGRCVLSGCPAVDLDCVCKADGLCTTQCPNLLKDPDCSPDCISNGVCAKGRCPVPDVDCGNFSGTCSRPQDCLSGRCVTDPQHLRPYCTASCATTPECPGEMLCDATGTCRYRQLPIMGKGGTCVSGQTLCESDTVCLAEPGQPSRCVARCGSDADCDPPSVCGLSDDGLMLCRPATVLQRARAEGPAATPSSCSATPGGLVGWALLVRLLRARAKRLRRLTSS